MIQLFAAANLFLFMVFLVYYDAIEIQNTIGFHTLFLSVVASVYRYLIIDRNRDSAISFGFINWIALIAIFHNINFLTASNYNGQYIIEDITRNSHLRETWRLRLDNQKSIGIEVSEPPSDGSVDLQLKKGIFQVYFGFWKKKN